MESPSGFSLSRQQLQHSEVPLQLARDVSGAGPQLRHRHGAFCLLGFGGGRWTEVPELARQSELSRRDGTVVDGSRADKEEKHKIK